MPPEIRAVLDTNVFVAGLLNPSGSPGKILKALKERSFVLVTSQAVNEEILEVLNRPRLRDKYGLEGYLFDIAYILQEIAEIVPKLPTIRVSKDPDDNKFLSTAVGGHADYLVTDDIKDLLSLKEYRTVRILSPKEFLEITK